MKAHLKKYALAFMIFVGTALFVVIGTVFAPQLRVVYMASGTTPDSRATANSAMDAVKFLFESVEHRDWADAYRFVANTQDVKLNAFARDVDGADGSLRTFATLSDFSQETLTKSANEALIRVDLQWSTTVGALYEQKEFKVVPTKAGWRVMWPVEKQARVPAQVVAVTYPRWDVSEGPGGESAQPPHVRILSQSITQDADTLVVVGEVANEDPVPAFVSVNGTLAAPGAANTVEEDSFDYMLHILLPKQVTPFRIEFPLTQKNQAKDVRISVHAVAVSASADPIVSVVNPHIETADDGQQTLVGEIVNQSGADVNIPHVLASFSDESGKVIWVAGTYLDNALFPQTPLKFAMKIPRSVTGKIKNFRVVVNTYRMEQI